MDDTLKQQPPTDPLERVHTLARDLAYGALNGQWGSKISYVFYARDQWMWISSDGNPDVINDYLSAKWGDNHPTPDMLMSFGYFSLLEQRDSGTIVYLLTDKAFKLLEKPTTPPSVFISYRRNQSSALGLLIVARLKAVGVVNPFIDMVIDPGAEWHALLEKTIRQSTYFIALIAPATLESKYVQREIEWALNTPNQVIIPFWHGGFSPGTDYPTALGTRNAIRLKEESAEEYELAMIKLLNRLGYGP